MSKQTVEFCTARDLPELFSRFADWYRFNPRMRERDYFDWQFKSAPKRLADAEYDFLILRESGEIRGCLGFTGFEFELGDRLATGGWTHNWYAHDQRDGGLALLLRFMELVDNRFSIRFNENTARVFSLLKVPMVPALPRWWAAIDADACTTLFQFDQRDTAEVRRSSGMLHKLVSEPCEAIVRFDPASDFSLAHYGSRIGYAKRTGHYLNWRYFDIPRHNYRGIKIADQFAVFRVEPVMDSDFSVIRILEWTFDVTRAPSAVASIVGMTEKQRPILLDFHCSCELIGQAIEAFGFVRQTTTTKPMPDLFRPTNNSGGIAIAIDLPPHRTARHINFSNWYITAGDSDVDRIKL